MLIKRTIERLVRHKRIQTLIPRSPRIKDRKESLKMFWGVTLSSGSCPTRVLDHSLRLTMAVVSTPWSPDIDKNAIAQVRAHHERRSCVICTLGGPDRIWQVPLNLKFMKGSTIRFSVTCHEENLTVDLSGYLVPDDKADKENEQASEIGDEWDLSIL